VLAAGAGVALIACGAALLSASVPAARASDASVAALFLILAGILGLLVAPIVGAGPPRRTGAGAAPARDEGGQ
jgi:hypothetical protein